MKLSTTGRGRAPRTGAGGLTVPVVFLLVGALAACQGSAPAGVPSTEAAEWAAGPVRWLLLPEEAKELRRLRTARDVAAFRERFWRRRDPTPGDTVNPFRESFEARVVAADRLYGEPERPGSLSDRGRAYLLLGPPGHLKVAKRSVPGWEATSGGPPRVTTRLVDVESWGYGPAELPPSLCKLLVERGEPLKVSLAFLLEGGQLRLIEGGQILVLAARAAVTRRLSAGGGREG